MAEESTQGLQVNPEVPSTGKDGISPESESKIQDALDDAFGGVDDSDREGGEEATDQSAGEPGRGDDDGDAVTVREHKRRRAPKRKEKAPPPKRSQWGEDEGTEAGREDAAEEDDDEGAEAPAKSKPDASEAAADTEDDDDGEPTSPYGSVEPRLVNAAKRRGWSDDRIRRLVKADEDLAIDTFEQLLEDANNLTREYAAIGRQVQSANGQTPPPPQDQAGDPGQPAQDQQTPYGQGQLPVQQGQQPQAGQVPQGQAQQNGQQQGGLLPKFQFQEEQTQGLDEGFTQSILQPIQEHMDRIGQVLNNVVAGHDRFIQERQEEILYQQIDSYFDKLSGDFGDLYGKGARSELPKETLENRRRVVREADAIRYGAMAQGRNLSVSEALEMAHNLVSSPHRDQAARRKITDGLNKRQSQVTLQPTNKTGRNEHDSGDPLERAEKNLSKRLKKLG